MPGGRNKYTGPVNYSEEDVDNILTGREYVSNSLTSSSPASKLALTASQTLNSNSNSLPNSQQLANSNSCNRLLIQAKSKAEANANVNSASNPPMPSFLSVFNGQTAFTPVSQVNFPQRAAQKRRRSTASELANQPKSKMLAHESSMLPSFAQQVPSFTPNLHEMSPFFMPIINPFLSKILDKIEDADEPDMLNFSTIWPEFKLKEKVSKDEFLEAVPKIAEAVSPFSNFLSDQHLR